MDLTERLELYQRQNAERFGRIEEELREIRSDLKKIPYWFRGFSFLQRRHLVVLHLVDLLVAKAKIFTQQHFCS